MIRKTLIFLSRSSLPCTKLLNLRKLSLIFSCQFVVQKQTFEVNFHQGIDCGDLFTLQSAVYLQTKLPRNNYLFLVLFVKIILLRTHIIKVKRTVV